MTLSDTYEPQYQAESPYGANSVLLPVALLYTTDHNNYFVELDDFSAGNCFF